MRFAEQGPEVLRVRVRLTPRASQDRVDGTDDAGTHLLVRVRAQPSEGEANAALLIVLAGVLGLPKSALRLAAGCRGRQKIVLASGDPARLRDALERLEKSVAAAVD